MQAGSRLLWTGVTGVGSFLLGVALVCIRETASWEQSGMYSGTHNTTIQANYLVCGAMAMFLGSCLIVLYCYRKTDPRLVGNGRD